MSPGKPTLFFVRGRPQDFFILALVGKNMDDRRRRACRCGWRHSLMRILRMPEGRGFGR